MFHYYAQRNSVLSPAELPGSRPAIQLASSARGFILQHIVDRLNLICAQHNLGLSSKNVATLMSNAFEVKCLTRLQLRFASLYAGQTQVSYYASSCDDYNVSFRLNHPTVSTALVGPSALCVYIRYPVHYLSLRPPQPFSGRGSLDSRRKRVS